jgi:hypothetical protein
MTMRTITLLLTATVALAMAGCGSDEARPKAPPGAPQNPVAAITPEPQGMTGETKGNPATPGYQRLLDNQRKAPAEPKQANPCALVTKAQAQTILGGKLMDPVSLPQGPTCIYRNRSNGRYATISVQAQNFAVLRKQLKRAQRVDVADRRAYCGVHGRPMLYLPLGGGKVLTIAAQCETAVRLARRAGAQLLP